MPYAPGNQNIRGQLMAQGIDSATSSIADGIKQYQQNKVLASDAIGRFQGLADADTQAKKANPTAYPGDSLTEFLSKDAESDNPSVAAKLFDKLHKDGALNYRDAATLAQYADSYGKRQQAQSENNVRNLQAQEYAQRIRLQQKSEDDSAKIEAARAAAALPQLGSSQPDQSPDPSLFQNSNLAPFMQQAQQRQAQPVSGADFTRRFLQSGAPLDATTERVMGMMNNADVRDALTQERATAAAAQTSQREAAANLRADRAEAQMKEMKGPYKTPTEALKAGQDAIDALGDKSQVPELVPMHGGTFSVTTRKPNATHDDVATRAQAKLQDAQDSLDEALASGDPKAIERAKGSVKFWSDRATTISTRPLPQKVQEINALQGLNADGTPKTAAPQSVYKTPQDVGAAMKAGKLSRADAERILQQQFNFK